ncbi:hypothetical protein DL767_008240 [Monosporascus sp. MG133]|nr:hypothetical protein DL767_008240 [Monosporascus sp. MG133]
MSGTIYNPNWPNPPPPPFRFNLQAAVFVPSQPQQPLAFQSNPQAASYPLFQTQAQVPPPQPSYYSQLLPPQAILQQPYYVTHSP